jgi:hypothetical protein
VASANDTPDAQFSKPRIAAFISTQARSGLWVEYSRRWEIKSMLSRWTHQTDYGKRLLDVLLNNQRVAISGELLHVKNS